MGIIATIVQQCDCLESIIGPVINRTTITKAKFKMFLTCCTKSEKFVTKELVMYSILLNLYDCIENITDILSNISEVINKDVGKKINEGQYLMHMKMTQKLYEIHQSLRGLEQYDAIEIEDAEFLIVR